VRLEFSSFVESDLDDIATHIAHDNPRRAVTFKKKLRIIEDIVRIERVAYGPRNLPTVLDR
jgi:hypothetical protein